MHLVQLAPGAAALHVEISQTTEQKTPDVPGLSGRAASNVARVDPGLSLHSKVYEYERFHRFIIHASKLCMSSTASVTDYAFQIH